MGRVDRGAKAARKFNSACRRSPTKYLQRFTFETIVQSKSVMQFAMSEVGAERIMIGSDCSSTWDTSSPVHFLDEVNMTSQQRKLILVHNDTRFLKL